ncbi:MAG: patatin-like phospholipase family protein [Treponemataceae bacterium]|nr:patatin-like phospholipase family protein [Treponemataceae bacterium]
MVYDRALPWALVLSGGGAKGFAHVGVLKVLEAMGVPSPSLIVGTSMGAIVGGLYACGYKATELEKLALHFDIRDYLDSKVFRMEGPLGKLMQTGQIVGRLATKPGIDSGKIILSYLEELTRRCLMEETAIPFRCNAVDLVSGREIVFSRGSLALALRASMAFPTFFDPVYMDEMVLVDGGLVNNLAISVARRRGFTHILAVDVGIFTLYHSAKLQTGPQILYRCLEVVGHHLYRGDMDRASLTLQPRDDTSPFAFARAAHLIRLGEETALAQREALEHFFTPGWFKRLTLQRQVQRLGKTVPAEE